MKIRMLVWACVFGSAIAARADEEADRAALRVIKAAYEEACKTGDPQKIAPHLGTNVTGVMVTGEDVAGLDGLKAYWSKIQALMGPGGQYETAITVDSTEFFGDNALSRGTTADVVRLAGGRELKFASRWTAVCRKENGAWKIHRMQASMNPVENVFITARVTSAKMIYGAGGVLSGFLFGFILFNRRKASAPGAAGK